MSVRSSTEESRVAQSAATSMPPGAGRLIGLLVGSTFVLILNETIMSVSLPVLMVEFSIPASSAQWLTTIFLLTMAVVIPVSGWAILRFTLRSVFITAMSAFAIGTLMAAVAPVFAVLVAARAVQAFGTALMLPLLITTVMTLVPATRRGQMMGVISIVISVAPAVGPTISGIVLDQLSWRFMFWLVLPVAVLSLAAGCVWVRNINARTMTPLHVPSVVLSAVAFGGLIFGLSRIGESGPGRSWVLPAAAMAVGAAALMVFVGWQLRLGSLALLDMRAFGTGVFAIAIAVMAVSMIALFGTLIILSLYLQDVLGLSTLATGLVLLPGGLVMGLLAPLIGSIYDRFGPLPVVVPGSVILSGGLWLMTLLDTGTGRGTVVAFHVVVSIGLALLLTPLMTTALGALPPRVYSHGSAILSTAQQVAGAVGTALFITVMTRRSAGSLDDGLSVVAATAEGIHRAFVYGAVISFVAVVLAPWVRWSKDVRSAERPV